MWESPWLFGKEISAIVQLYNASFRVSETHGYKVFHDLMSGKPEELSQSEFDKIRGLLSIVGSQERNSDTQSHLEQVSLEIRKTFESKEKEIEKNIRSVFGSDLPKAVTIILSEDPGPNVVHGGALGINKEERTSIFGLGVGKLDKSSKDVVVPILIHEMLHNIIDLDDTLTKKARPIWFEEAVLDYFVSNGMMSAKLGLLPEKEISQYNSENTKRRPYSKEISDKLLPSMKEYWENYGKKTVWHFLSERGFSEYISPRFRQHVKAVKR